MKFCELNLEENYRTGRNDVTNEFFIPLLDSSIKYDRAVGYFSSTALIEISKGLSNFLLNGGIMRIITSPELSNEDIEAIDFGYVTRKELIEKRIIESIQTPKNYYEEERLNYIATMIANNQLDIKIAVVDNINGMGIYHEKIGIFSDIDGNCVAFTGSLNESYNAFNNNFESIDVFCSWKENDRKRVESKLCDFEKMWLNETLEVEILDFPDIAKEKLLKFQKSKIVLDLELEKWLKKSNKKDFEPHIPDNFALYDYQIQAIENWKRHNYQGIFNMATGTGKTKTSLGAVIELIKDKKRVAVIICCPYQHLVEQWGQELRDFSFKPIIGYSASTQKKWYENLKLAVLDFKLGVSDMFVFLTTNDTFSSIKVQEQIDKINSNSLLLIDEAHNFGSNSLKKLLHDSYPYRLALSATFTRQNDDEGTQALLEFFKNECINYSIDEAIISGKLTPYYYYPIFCYLNDDELEKYADLTDKISRLINIKGDNGKKASGLELLLMKRARILSGMEDKLIKLRNLLKTKKSIKQALVYCGATTLEKFDEENEQIENKRYIDEVTNLLGNKLKLKVGRYTSLESVKERENIKRQFVEEEIDVLVAIKCLDEGVDIPGIETAYILASTTNRKEYIQRRGRVLRKAKNKSYAYIYDFIALPRNYKEVSRGLSQYRKYEKGIVERELERIAEFNNSCVNKFENYKIVEELKEEFLFKEEKWQI